MRRKKVQELIDAPKIGDYRVKIEVRGDGRTWWQLEKFVEDGGCYSNWLFSEFEPDWSARGAWRVATSPSAAVKAARSEVKARRLSEFNERPIGTFTVRL